MAIGKISTIKRKEQFAPDTTPGSLQRAGLTRAPKTKMIMYPAKNIDGSYRTGLDPNASYINRMPPEEAELERSRVEGYLEMAKQFYPDVDLGPRAPFWKDMVKRSGHADVAPVANLVDGDNYYDLDNPQALIVYCYLRVHPTIAPSGQAVLQGHYGKATYYVNDYDVETAVAYKKKTKITKAVSKLDSMTLEKRKMIARQLGLRISEDAKEEAVYVALYDYINEIDSKKSSNIDLFGTLADMKDENLLIKDVVKQALEYNVLRKNGFVLMRGDNQVAKDEQSYAEHLSNVKNQDELISIQEEIKLKKSLKYS